tara:strand:+ start:1948 stop:2775 length:828 start_codon:yes stop_codon:yes gene_type:complete
MAEDKNIKYTRNTINRAEQVRRDNDKIPEVKIGLYEIDETIKYFFDNVVKLQVKDSSGLITNVPVVYATPENWKSLQASDLKRDSRGKVQLPLLAYKRDSISKDRNLGNKVDINEPLYVKVDQGYNKSNRYDKLSVMQDMLRGRKEVQVYKKLIVPDYLTVSYSVIVYTEFLTQMNTLIEAISYNEGSYWGDKNKFLVRTKVDDFPSVVEGNVGEDRIVKSEFQITINGHIIPKSIQTQAALGSAKTLTKAQIVLNEHTVTDINNAGIDPATQTQ